jgi:hypothetical protein
MVRNSTAYLAVTSGLVALLTGLLINGNTELTNAGPLLSRMTGMVSRLKLTDLCLFTEASYTRHLAMTDLNTPFQDSPFTFEHFPTGALVSPPPHLRRNRGQID